MALLSGLTKQIGSLKQLRVIFIFFLLQNCSITASMGVHHLVIRLCFFSKLEIGRILAGDF